MGFVAFISMLYSVFIQNADKYIHINKVSYFFSLPSPYLASIITGYVSHNLF